MKKIFFWSPYNSNIGTINSVINSIESIDKFSRKNYDPYLINSIGEWNKFSDKYKLINFTNKYLDLSKMYSQGKFLSRIFYILVFLTSFFQLRKLLANSKPTFFVAHLITSLPLILFILFDFKSKLILRISGEPNLNIFRKILWRMASKKIFCVTCPSIETVNFLVNNDIFPKNKIKVLLDPAINIQEIRNKKKEKLISEFQGFEYILSVGRLTRQKNFEFLIDTFVKINKIYPNLKLIILGEGELLSNLTKKINQLNLTGVVFLLGFKQNIFNYLSKAKCLILPSLYENPGHVLMEAAASNCTILSSDCPTGPAEFLDYGKGGYIFKVNSEEDLIKKLSLFINDSDENIKSKKIIAKKKSKKYTKYQHYLIFNKILSNE